MSIYYASSYLSFFRMADQAAANGADPANNAAAAPVVNPPHAAGGEGRVAEAGARQGVPFVYPQMQWVRRPDPTQALLMESIRNLLDNRGIFIFI